MKEKIKKVFYAIFSWKGLFWLNLILFGMHIIAAVYHRNIEPLLGGFPMLLYAWFCWLIREEEKKVHRGVILSTFFKMIADTAIERLERYQKLYGELPPEEETEKKEEKKEE